MIKKEQLNGEIKVGKIKLNENNEYLIEDYDKDLNLIETHTIDDLLNEFINKEHVRIRVDYLKEI